MVFDQPFAISTPFSTLDMLFGLGAAGVFFISILLTVARWPERRIILVALLTKLSAGIFYCALVYFFASELNSDSLNYHTSGVELADALRGDLENGSSDYLSRDPFFGIEGNSATRMDSFSGLIHFLCFDSFLASSFVCGFLAFIGQLLIYRTFTAYYPDPRIRLWWQVGILFFPTLTFWSSGLLKDPLGIFGLGLTLWGIHSLFQGFRSGSAVLTAVGLYVLFLFRPLVLPLFFLAAIPWFFKKGTIASNQSSGIFFRRVMLISFVLVGIGAIILVTEVEPRYSFNSAPEAIVRQSQGYDPSTGGSTDTDFILDDASWTGLLVAWPASVVFMLYRPFPWEAFASPLHLMACLENLFLLALSVRAVWQVFSQGTIFRDLLGSPFFLMCFIFVLFSSFAVGLSTPNLGTISRYRLPAMPFFVGIITVIEYYFIKHRRDAIVSYD